jgi:hypothetical protein
VFGHQAAPGARDPTLPAGRFAAVSKLLNLGYVAGGFDAILRLRSGKEPVRPSTRASRLAFGVVAAVLLAARPAAPQFVSFSGNPHNVLEGNWQSCQENNGRYAERVYDHVVNGVGQFEVHLGPRREFAIFKGVQDEHRDHDSADNLLRPFRVAMEGTRAKQRWEIKSLNLAFTVTLGGGSRTDCESWFILLEPLEKTSH